MARADDHRFKKYHESARLPGSQTPRNYPAALRWRGLPVTIPATAGAAASALCAGPDPILPRLRRTELVQEVLSRTMRDRRAVARYAGLTGSPDESGAKRRDKGLARSGNARVIRA
jgi:hypothetical protein